MTIKNSGKAVTLIIVLVAILVGGYVFAKKAGYLPENGKSDIVQPLLGGDKDEHGCIGSAGYSWCEAKQKCLRVWEEKCESVTLTSVTIPSDWKTYKNEAFGFEIKYPSDFVATADKYSKELIWLQSKSQPELLEPFIAVGKEKYTLLFQGGWSPVPYSQAGTAKIVSSENIIVNNISFNRDTWSIRSGIDNVISYNTNYNGKYYTIYRGISSPSDEAIFDQILSTFKFTK